VTPVPQYWPTPEDFKALAFIRIDALAKDSPSVMRLKSPTDDGYVGDSYGQYASVYIASECLAGMDMSFAGFGEFIDQKLLMVQSDDGRETIELTGQNVISRIVSTAALRIELGLSPSVSSCMRPYLYPESATEAILAIELVKSLHSLS